ncbi:MAG: VCBS repeat-containing protein [Acidobacteria bacterium]|nr:VCBS repeat-containing protein [Acidobacteriota bacterium]HMU33450.1 zinc-dependent metalloprotease family protein [Pyrinomonadaceae bacterium]
MNTHLMFRGVLSLSLVLAFLVIGASAQQLIWTENQQDRSTITTDRAVLRASYPTDFRLYNLNIEPLREQLFSIAGRSSGESVVISIPNADGDMERFEVYEDSNFDAALQARFPEIRAYSGRGLTDRFSTLKLSISPQGIQTVVFRSDAHNEFIEPFSADHKVYSVFRRDGESGGSPWRCTTGDVGFLTGIRDSYRLNGDVASRPDSNAGQIKTMRLAQSCNGEYANYFGATSASQVALVLAAFNATLTRANGVYEKDLAVHLNLIDSTTNVIYYNPATDPYSTLGNWNGELQATLTANIGEANYDIGHMFGASGGGGNAGCIGCVCVDGQKGSGITSPGDGVPQGDNFDIDYVVHEVGHQMGANHTFSFSLEGTGRNKEVGSGITIMGYAGITPYDVAPHSIDTFHQTSIEQIQANLANKTCPVTTNMTQNHPPVVSSVPNYTIPISTPFALTGSATDPDGDSLTYQWEQNDNATSSGSSSPASPGKTTGPNWLSFPPTASPTRYFPKMATVLAGLLVSPTLPGGDAVANTEALSSVSRTLNFRLTVRDNKPYVPGVTIGQTQYTDSVITVTNSSGPFKVTSPNTSIQVAGGSVQTVTWNVANTTAAPVSVANVKISLSTDGGQTFPTVLLASTPNDGSADVTIPMGVTSQARVKIEAVGNVFFDVSDANFSVTAPVRAKYDFDGDGKSDVSVFRPSDGNWHMLRSTAGYAVAHWGISTDVPAPGDFDGDAKADLAIFRGDANSANPDFYIFNSSNSTITFLSFGLPGDVPVNADYDGDGKTDVAVYRPSDGGWYALKSTGGLIYTTIPNAAGTIPAPGDFDGDGKADIAYYNGAAGSFTYRPSTGGFPTTATGMGTSSDVPVIADYSGDGKAEIALFRTLTGDWFIYNPAAGTSSTIHFGLLGDIPTPGDYDGDGRTDLAVYRSGTWYLLRSTAGFTAYGFGLSNDVPIPGR